MNDVTCINGVDWSFSYKAFVEFIADLEEVSKWRYSGESELLLIQFHDNVLDFSEVGVFHLDAMINDDVISSVSSFITGLSRCIKRNNSVTSITARAAVKSVTKTIVEEITDTLPTYISKPLNRGKYYMCRNFSL